MRSGNGSIADIASAHHAHVRGGTLRAVWFKSLLWFHILFNFRQSRISIKFIEQCRTSPQKRSVLMLLHCSGAHLDMKNTVANYIRKPQYVAHDH